MSFNRIKFFNLFLLFTHVTQNKLNASKIIAWTKNIWTFTQTIY